MTEPLAPAATRPFARDRREAWSGAGVLVERIAWLGIVLVPGLLTAYLSFNTGGLYAEDYAAVLALLALGLAAHALLSKRPFAGLGGVTLVAGGALMLLSAWALASGGWSDAPGRALFEAQRIALYGFAFLLLAALPRRPGGVALVLKGVAAAILAVCAAGLATRLYPDLFEVSGTMARGRLSFPITYWNGLGILAAIGVILSLHLASHEREHLAVRALGAAGVPLAAVTLFFTFSRGATGAVVAGVLLYVLIGRPRGALGALLAVLPTTYVAVRSAYDADLLATADNTTAAAAAQGHDVAAVVAAMCLGAAALRLVLGVLDHRLVGVRPPAISRANLAALAVVVAGAVTGLLVTLDVPDRIERSYDSFLAADRTATDARTRLNDTRLGVRRDHWNVALDEYRGHRLNGVGAGTYETSWLKHRETPAETSEAHSLYFETLGELGLVGGALLVVALLAILGGVLMRARRERRVLCAAIFAAGAAWALHAGVDWDWELPALTLWLFALAGAALARAPGERRTRVAELATRWPARIAVAVVCLLVAVGAVRSAIADADLDTARSAFESGDCRTARADAASSIAAVGSRARPFEILAWCASERGDHSEAIRSMTAAADLDPEHWRYRYGLAIVRAAAGRDPKADLRHARRLNPLGQILSSGTAARLMVADRGAWERLAARATRPSGR